MSTGAQRAHLRLAQRRADVEKIYADTPHIWPIQFRQVRRRQEQLRLKEATALEARAERKKKRARKRAEKEINV